MPFYTGDYLRDTRHLGPLRHGVYMLLLIHCWDCKGPLPLDRDELAAIANCRSSEEMQALDYVLKRYFVSMDDGYYNERMQREVERSEAIAKRRSLAGRKGFQARAQHLPGKSQASASTPTPTPIPTPSPRQGDPSGRLSGNARRQASIRLLEKLNTMTGRHYEPVEANLKLIGARLDEYGEARLSGMLELMISRWSGDSKMDEYLRPGTLFGKSNCAQYTGEVPAEEDLFNGKH